MTTPTRPRRPRRRGPTAEEMAALRKQRIKELVDAAPPITGDLRARLMVWATATRRQIDATSGQS